MQSPIISVTFAYFAGLLLGHGFLYTPFAVASLIVPTILSVAIFSRANASRSMRALLLIVPALCGISFYLYSAASIPANHLSRIAPSGKALHEITGRIVSPLDRDTDRISAVIAVSHIDGTPVSGRARMTVRDVRPSIGYNDTIRVTGRIFAPRGYNNPGGFDYPGYLAQNGIFRSISVKDADRIEVLTRGQGLFRTIQDRRERIRQSFLASTTGPGSAILQAMVLGEEGGLTEELRDQFMVAGVTHIISISGSHLGMVAVLCFALIRGLLFLLPEALYHRLTLYTEPRKIAAWLTLPLVIFYTLLAGGQTATVRSLIMISAGLAALILDRDHALLHSLAFAALVTMIMSPQVVFDISFQLSYLSVLVIAVVVSLGNELGLAAGNRFQKIRNSVIMLVAVSLAASLATGPLVARYFNQFSIAGIVSNLFVVPFAGMIVVPLGLFSAILSLFTHTLPLAGLNQIAGDAFIRLVELFAGLPLAEFHPRTPGVLWIGCYAALLASAFASFRLFLLARYRPLEHTQRVPRFIKLIVLASGAGLIIVSALPFGANEATMLSFPDVGQGDCCVISFASGKTILIDGGGTHDNRFDIGRRIVAPFLWSRGIGKLDVVILSHPHPDHMNGLLYALRKFPVDELWTHGFDDDLPGYAALREIAARKGTPRRIVSVDHGPFLIGNAEVSILHPAEGFEAVGEKAYAAENDRSLVVSIADKNGNYLFPGDIGAHAEHELAGRGQELKCDVLKVPHHGSRSSSTASFLSLTRPTVAVVTAGSDNSYGHPADEVLERYQQSGASIVRTDRDGAVIIRAHQGRMDVVRSRDMMLQRIELNEHGAWWEREQENWKRLWIRAWEI